VTFNLINGKTLRGPIPLMVVLDVQPTLGTSSEVYANTTGVADFVLHGAVGVRMSASSAGARRCLVSAEWCGGTGSSAAAELRRRCVEWLGRSLSSPRVAVSTTASPCWLTAEGSVVVAVLRGG